MFCVTIGSFLKPRGHDISWCPWVGGRDLNCNYQFLVKALCGHKLPWVQVADRPALSEPGPSLPEDEDHLGGESTQEGDEGLFIPSFLEEALGGDGNLQIKMARTMQAQEKCDRRCFICQSVDHLMKDHYQGKNGMGPPQLKGSLQNKSAHEMATASPLS